MVRAALINPDHLGGRGAASQDEAVPVKDDTLVCQQHTEELPRPEPAEGELLETLSPLFTLVMMK